MASGAGVVAAGRDIMQGDYFGRGGQTAMTGVATITGQGEEVAVFLFMAHWVTCDAGDRDWCIYCETIAVGDRVLDILANTVTMAGDAIALVDDIDVAHAGCDMAGGTACGGRDHVMLHRSWRRRMVRIILDAVAVGAVLRDAGFAINDRVFDLLSCGGGMAFETGIFCIAEGHDMNDTGGAGIRAVMTGRAEGIRAQIDHMGAPGLKMANGAVWWRFGE